MSVQDALFDAAKRLRDLTEQLTPKLLDECDNIDWIYNPLVYAWAPHSEYIRRHGTQGAQTMLVGMNPGHGMGLFCVRHLVQVKKYSFAFFMSLYHSSLSGTSYKKSDALSRSALSFICMYNIKYIYI